ncbi:MAG: hypothetical protein JWP97_2740 [Labilithrix sp.]|nr:hypothetical protein [Labilithrix sp.]
MRREQAPPAPAGMLGAAQREIEHLHRMLLDQQRFGHAVLDAVDVGIVTTDADGAVTFVNRTGRKLLQLADDAVGAPVQEVLGLAQPPGRMLGVEGRRALRHVLSPREGVDLDLELSISRGLDVAGFFLVFRDIREEKVREAERQRFERLAAMGTMVAGFAHEVRNPVAAMRSIAEELGEELTDAGVAFPHVGLMLQMVERIERLVKTSLQFGRPATPRRGHHRPWNLASSAIDELRARIRRTGEEIAFEAEPELPDVYIDERQLAQVLVILLHNALDASESGARVTLRVRRAHGGEALERDHGRRSEPPGAGSVRFEVINHGSSIPPEIIGRIFDPFFTTKPSGTGLGLSIAQQLVSENGARLEVVSSAGITTFSILVPVLPSLPAETGSSS